MNTCCNLTWLTPLKVKNLSNQILLGADHYWAKSREIPYKPQVDTASCTHLGWVLSWCYLVQETGNARVGTASLVTHNFKMTDHDNSSDQLKAF